MHSNDNSVTYSQTKVASLNIFPNQKFIVMFTVNRTLQSAFHLYAGCRCLHVVVQCYHHVLCSGKWESVYVHVKICF